MKSEASVASALQFLRSIVTDLQDIKPRDLGTPVAQCLSHVHEVHRNTHTHMARWTQKRTAPYLEVIDKYCFAGFSLQMMTLKNICIIIIIIMSSTSQLCRVFTLIFLRQTMSLGNTVLQLFWCYYSWCADR
jgi:hypothetical protein